ncbi:MAG: bifunctional glycosyltransferase/class I SAM-dependent methyltransferase [Thermodesulfobacteriota bacterium]
MNKVLIFIVAYNAEQHIEKVLLRIPPEIFEKYNYEILIIDDSSKDNTFAVARQFQKKNTALNIKVLYNPVNQGYGGNQKLGYQYAINHNFDAVVLLHGDGQYAPELIADIFSPLLRNEADAVFGSRMMIKGAARKGGMPLYKFAGNKILTFLENRMLGASLSEFHSGYRAYAVEALRRIPFQHNSPDFHFDTEIIIQLLLAGQRIHETPIPTYYGDEICHVNGIKYAWDVLVACFQSRLQRLSILYQRKYDIDQESSHYTLKLGYESSHTRAINRIEPDSRVLDIGACEGLISGELKKKGCHVYGIDQLPVKDKANFDGYTRCDLNKPELPHDIETYDYVLMLDIIEHLQSPEAFMDTLREQLKLNRATIVLTTPNIAFAIVRLQLLLGQFNYGKAGILDITHSRLFTFKTLRHLCDECGYIVKELKGIPVPFPKAVGNNVMGRFLIGINKLLIKISKSLFSYQIYAELQPTPMVENMLEHTIRTSAGSPAETDIEP